MRVSLLVVAVHLAVAFAASPKLRNMADMPDKRHEHAICDFKGKIFVIGGRGTKKIRAYNDNSGKWEDYGFPPNSVGSNFHHFQCFSFNDGIVVGGAFRGGYPNEDPMGDVWLYKPKSGNWNKLTTFPSNRNRGACGAFKRGNSLYFVAGNVNGHGNGETTSKFWFDKYDTKANKWSTLPDTKKRRDHFGAVYRSGKAFAVGGRLGGASNFGAAANGVKEIEEYDFSTNKWVVRASTSVAHPGMTPAIKRKKIYIGDGELAGKTNEDTNKVEVYHTGKKKMVMQGKLPKFKHRHGTGYAMCNGILFTATGAQRPGNGQNIEFESTQGIHLNGDTSRRCKPNSSYW